MSAVLIGKWTVSHYDDDDDDDDEDDDEMCGRILWGVGPSLSTNKNVLLFEVKGDTVCSMRVVKYFDCC